MSNPQGEQAPRSWQEIAAEVANEQDRTKLAKLCDELAKALEKCKSELPHPSSKPPKVYDA